MSKMQALGHFIQWCNQNVGTKGVTQESFEAGSKIILSSSDTRFAGCNTVEDVLRVLRWPNY